MALAVIGAALLVVAAIGAGILVIVDDSEADPTASPTPTEADPTADADDEPAQTPAPTPTAEPTQEPTDRGTSEGVQRAINPFELGDEISGTITVGGQWHGELTLTEETAVVLDPRAEANAPLNMNLTILDSTGQEIFFNEDRDPSLASGAYVADPYAAVVLGPDEYRVTIDTTERGSAGNFTMTTHAAETITAGEGAEAELASDEHAHYALAIEQAGQYLITTSVEPDDGVNAALVLYEDHENVQVFDEYTAEAWLEVTLEPGTYPLVAANSRGGTTTMTTSVQQY